MNVSVPQPDQSVEKSGKSGLTLMPPANIWSGDVKGWRDVSVLRISRKVRFFFSFLAEFFEGVWKIQNERWCRSASDKCVDKQLRVFTSARTIKSTSDNLQPNVKQIFVGWRWRRNEGLGTSFVFCFVFFPGRFQKTFHKNSKAYNTFLDKSAISCVQCAQKNSSENNLR